MKGEFYISGDNYTIKKIYYTIIQFIFHKKLGIEQLLGNISKIENKTRLFDQN
jgi:hypothetical protein